MTKHSSTWFLVSALSVGLAAASVHAQVRPGAPSIDEPPAAGSRGASLARLVLELSSEQLSAREQVEAIDGVEVVDAWRRFLLVNATLSGRTLLARSPAVARVFDARPPLTRPTDDRGRAITRVDAAQTFAFRAEPARDQLTGQGVRVAVIDTPFDVFHPAFFHGDAGYESFVDLNDDGALTIGVDGVDLDRDGMVAPSEVLQLLQAAHRSPDGDVDVLRRGEFDPSIDWVFLDTNGNGVRDFGEAAGATEQTPAYGEPVFAPDDFDRSGSVEIRERLVRLGTSKISRLRLDSLSGYDLATDLTREWVRGADLVQAPRRFAPDTPFYEGGEGASHGTAVAGIIAGDLPLLGRRWVGTAPDSELVVSTRYDTYRALFWALNLGAQVFNYSFIAYYEPQDGDDGFGRILSESTALGAVHVCGAGNDGDTRTHIAVQIPARGSLAIPVDLPEGLQGWSLHVISRIEDYSFTVTAPDGQTVSNDGSFMVLDFGGATAQMNSYTYDSARSTTRSFDHYAASAGMTVTSGRYVLTLMNASEAPSEVMVRAVSPESNVRFNGDVASSRGTVTWPATSDDCISVGAIPAYLAEEGQWASYPGDERAGEVRAYSSRGPRIDGALGIDLVAPDNVLAPFGPYSRPEHIVREGTYHIIGGTSSAAPQVAGAAALLTQLGLRGSDIRARLRATAADDGYATSLPDSDYGYGRLDVYAAVAGESGPRDLGQPPTVTISASATAVHAGAEVTLTASAIDPDGQPISIRWDDGYDGIWDTDYGAATERVWVPRGNSPDGTGWAWAKVRVRDAEGFLAEASIRLQVQPPQPLPQGGCGCRTSTTTSTPFAFGWVALIAVAARIRRKKARVSRS